MSSFYFLFYYFFLFFTYVLFLVFTRTSNPPHLPPFVSEALFCLCRGTNIYNSFGGASEFQDTYHGFVYFFYSSQWILYIDGARETQEDTL